MPKKCQLLVSKVYCLGTAFQLIEATSELQQKLFGFLIAPDSFTSLSAPFQAQ